MRYGPETDHYVPIEWDAAFASIARELNALDDPNQAGVLYLGPLLERGGIHVPIICQAL
jgi:anaerobic selenocysteine-containing dehydrogenase